MIDQFNPGMSQVSQPASGSLRERNQPSDQNDGSSSFEDLISRAGDRQAQEKGQESREGAADDAPALPRTGDTLPKAVFELSASLKDATDPTRQTKAKLAAFQNVLKVADKGQPVEGQAELALAKLAERIRQDGKIDKHAAAEAAAALQAEQLTPSDELGLLLGLTREGEARPVRKDATEKLDRKSTDDVEQADKADETMESGDVDPMLMTIASRDSRGEDAAAEDRGGREAAIVRVDSANGRGRSVDIDLQEMPGAQRPEAAKSSSTPKVETATVLEARRYLGFSTETNGTALATAISSDPTWTEALQSAQRVADVKTLASTVTEVNTLKLQMNPENMGSMVASLKLKGEELTVELRVNSAEAYHRLMTDHDDIVQSLQDQGFTIDKVTVQLNAIDRTDTSADRDLARQQEKAQREGEAGREGRNGQSDRDDTQRDRQNRAPSPQHADGTAVDTRPGSGLPRNIYL